MNRMSLPPAMNNPMMGMPQMQRNMPLPGVMNHMMPQMQRNMPLPGLMNHMMPQMQRQSPGMMGPRFGQPKMFPRNQMGQNPPMSAYSNMPMPDFGNKKKSKGLFGGDSLGNDGQSFQPSKALMDMNKKPNFMESKYMKTKNFFKNEKLLI